MLCPRCHKEMQNDFCCDTTEYTERTYRCLTCRYSYTEKYEKETKCITTTSVPFGKIKYIDCSTIKFEEPICIH